MATKKEMLESLQAELKRLGIVPLSTISACRGLLAYIRVGNGCGTTKSKEARIAAIILAQTTWIGKRVQYANKIPPEIGTIKSIRPKSPEDVVAKRRRQPNLEIIPFEAGFRRDGQIHVNFIDFQYLLPIEEPDSPQSDSPLPPTE